MREHHTDEPWIVPPPVAITRATAVRATLLLSSQRALKQAGHYERYLSGLSESRREEFAHLLANTWLPIDYAIEHYRACDALGLSADETRALGTTVGTQINSIFVQSILRLATRAMTPWFAMRHAPRVWSRAWQGSHVIVRQTGPTAAEVTIVGFPCADIPYVRHAVEGFFTRNLGLFCDAPTVRVDASYREPEAMRHQLSWEP